MFFILVGVGGFPRTALSRRLWGIPDDLTARRLSNLLIVEPVVLISPIHHRIKKHPPFGGCFLFWWEWVDSNHLRLKPTDLQSAPALQLRRTPNLYSARLRQRLRWAMDFQPLLRCGENPWCGQRETARIKTQRVALLATS